MIEVCLLIILLVGFISYHYRLRVFNSLPIIQSEALTVYNNINDDFSLSELNDLFGKKAKKIFNSDKYRWYFGDSVLVKKNGVISSFEEFDRDIEHYRDYTFENCISYIEATEKDGVLSNLVAVGLN